MERLEIIIKQFKSTTQTENRTNEYTFSAIVKASYDKRFEMRVNSISYENGIIKSTCNSSIYYENFEELEKEFKYHYELNKDNLFTKKIEITI